MTVKPYFLIIAVIDSAVTIILVNLALYLYCTLKIKLSTTTTVCYAAMIAAICARLLLGLYELIRHNFNQFRPW